MPTPSRARPRRRRGGPARPGAGGGELLRADAIIEAARATGAEAIHPGYGFLSERASFARAVEDAGLVFIGPRRRCDRGAWRQARGPADRAGGRRAGRARDVRAGDRSIGPTTSRRSSTRRERDRVPAAGQGGRRRRGTRDASRRRRVEDCPLHWPPDRPRRSAAFGDGAVYLEREIRPARHIEVQLLGDADGTIVALGERDCSIQRRHQKLVEESPAPGLTDGRAARAPRPGGPAPPRAAGCTTRRPPSSCSTRERPFWFLEVNARLQVEHGVTELVTDLDLVAEQLWIAAGRPLSRGGSLAPPPRPRRRPPRDRGAARPPRTPAREFAPAPGRVGRWSMPAGPGVRVDTAVRAGRSRPARLRPADREAHGRRARPATAIDRLGCAGPRRGRRHRDPDDAAIPPAALVRDPAFLDGDLSIDWVADRWDLDSRIGQQHSSIAARAAARPRVVAVDRGLSVRKDEPGRAAWRADGRAAAIDRWPR